MPENDDERSRGRHCRPGELQLCLRCYGLRGPYAGFDNPCPCDVHAWPAPKAPRYGDLRCNVHLCWSCLTTLVQSGTRWSPYYCERCRPALMRYRRTANAVFGPRGPHSIMNGVSWSADGDRPITSTETAELHARLTRLHGVTRSFAELTTLRTRRLADRLRLVGDSVDVDDFTASSHAIGHDAHAGFIEFMRAIDPEASQEQIEEIWTQSLADVDGSMRPPRPSWVGYTRP